MSRAEYMRNYRAAKAGKPVPKAAIDEALGLGSGDIRHDIDTSEQRLVMMHETAMALTAERDALLDEVKSLKRQLAARTKDLEAREEQIHRQAFSGKPTAEHDSTHVPEYGGALIEWQGRGAFTDAMAGFGHSRPAPKPTSKPSKPKGR